MIQVKNNVQLQSLNTLNLASMASHYVEVHHLEQLENALTYAKQNNLNVLVISGGSNMLLPKTMQTLVLRILLNDVKIIDENSDNITVKVDAGQNWHDFVIYSTQQKWYGLQNLALIPGMVGASPVQNIGAYGVEVGEFIESVHVYDRESKKFTQLSHSECQFNYRHSVFKDYPDRYIIVAVTFCLKKQPSLKLAYGDLIQAVGHDETPENLLQQVIKIRQSKLPQPHEYPNVGSFFKNPILSDAQYQIISQKFAGIPSYIQADGRVKVAAGWLIDQVGWKGKRLGAVGMFAKQALVLVNYEKATLQDVQNTYKAVQSDVKQKFDIYLEPEPVLFDEMGQIRSHTD